MDRMKGVGIGVWVVLGSASPRRKDLLETMGLRFDIVAADIDESTRSNEDPARYVARLARSKALAVLADLSGDDHTVVIGADTCVVRDAEILGKPRNADDARTMLQSLSGRDHFVHTGVAMLFRNREATHVETTTVTFNVLSDATIDWYISTGDAFDKAGSYGMQSFGGVFVERIMGSVMLSPREERAAGSNASASRAANARRSTTLISARNCSA